MVDLNTVIDMAWLESATLDDLQKVLAMSKVSPQKLAEVNALLASQEGRDLANEMLNDPDYVPKSLRQPSPEEAAQIAADTALAEQQAAEAAAAQAAADAEAAQAAEAAAQAAQQAAAPVRKTIEYQVTDEVSGEPIGRPTHIEYSTEEELIEKMKNAHVHAVRYAERMKRSQNNRQKTNQLNAELRQVQAQAQQAEIEANEAAQIVVTEKDPVKVTEAIRKVSKADREKQIADETAARHTQIVAKAWMEDHPEFVPCQANSDLIKEWIIANRREFTYDTLEDAFTALEPKLAKQAPAQKPAVAVTNLPTAAPVAAPVPAAPIAQPAAPVAAPVSTSAPRAVTQPVATAPEPTPAVTPIAPTAARRPGVNASLQPGMSSAQRPEVVQPSQAATRDELLKVIAKMPGPEFRHKLKTSKQFRDQLEKAGIVVAGKSQYGS